MKRLIRVIVAMWVFTLPLTAQAVLQPDVVQLEEKLKTASLKEKIQLMNAFSQKNIETRPGLSLQYARQALKLAREGGDPADIVMATKNIGNWFYVTNQFKDALEYYLNTLAYEPQLENKRFIANVLTNIGMVYWKMNRYEKAEAFHRRALALREKTGYSDYEMGTTLNNLGLVLYPQGRGDEALVYFRKAVEIFKRSGSQRGLASVYNNIGDLYYSQKDYPRSLGNYDRALPVYEKVGLRWGIANANKNIGKVYLDMGDLARAEAHYERSLEISEKDSFNYLLTDLYKSVSGLYKKKGELRKALEFHEKYMKKHDYIFREKFGQQMSVLQARFDDRQKDARISLLLQKQETERMLIYTLVIAVVLILVVLAALVTRYRARKRLENERVRAAKLETVSLLAGGIAHDFNNLLAIIVGNLEMTIMETSPTAGTRKYLAQAEKATSAATTLAEKFMTISSSGFGYREKVKLATFIRDTVRFTVEKIGKPVDLRLQIPLDLGIVDGDVIQLKRVLENLTVNALDSIDAIGKSNGDGVLEVSAESLDLEDDGIASLPKGRYSAITFNDNGEGISPENLTRIFDPYFSTRDDVTRKGLGMGLAVAQSVVKRHGGTITVSSQPGEGSSFTLYLPISRD